MHENNIINLFKKNNTITKILNETKKETFSLYVNGVLRNHSILLASSIYKTNNEFVIYVCSNEYIANKVYDVLCEVIGYEDINLYLVDDVIATEAIVINNELKQERLNTLKSIYEKTPKIIVSHIAAMVKPVVSYEKFSNSFLTLKLNDTIVVNELIEKLISFGYKRVSTTYNIGEFSIRGEVIDIYPSSCITPVRINLGFDVIETIKCFDLESQLTNDSIEKILIPAYNEIVLDKTLDEFEKDLKEIEDNPIIGKDFDEIRDMNIYDKLHKYINYIDKDNTILLDYFEKSNLGHIIISENISEVKNAYDTLVYETFEHTKERLVFNKIKLKFYDEFFNFYKTDKRLVYFGQTKKALPQLELSGIYELDGFNTVDYQNDLKLFVQDLHSTKELIFLAFRNEARLNLVKEVLEQENVKYNLIDNVFNVYEEGINLCIIPNALSYGIFNYCKVIFEDEIFKKSKIKKSRYRSANENTLTISSSDDLLIGDYVVHYDYGISKYIGIKTEELSGIKNDYLQLQFENVTLLVPMEKITELEKYVGSDGVVPKLTKIGTNEWEKRKKAVKEQLENIAKALIELQLKRQETKGYKYSSDSQLQKEFEHDFEFVETKDQLSIVEEIKKEMEEGVLIDRLVCGDVGFGKTEIAMRIAFKTVFEGRQVVYMAPTTILSRQHFHTFKDRFLKYGIKVELLNRLISPSKQKEIIEGLADGSVDIVIGTHRLLNQEIKYKNLGLLVVDEEQRFGVVHKEKIKRLKDDVNVITLTATPIPRTFQMAVTGIRSLSLLETPPKDRYPIQTYVLEYSESIIREAIYRELARGGQVFYLHNRVSDLASLSKKIKKLVPEANVCVGHGKMDKNELEDVISNFIDGVYNVMICTTIIETGIDIPNSNTLIVDDAYKLGLAQMYQIRGRVGRSDRIAYAYFTYPPEKVLSDSAGKRLTAIKELTKIGSGYKIAVRDLAIRGAGDILGSEQSGFINSIGIEMYMKLLNEAVNHAKGIISEPKTNYRIEVSKHVERNYVDDDTIIIYIHKEINNIKNVMEKMKTINILTDRFGKLSNNVLDYIEERYLESNLRKFKVVKVIENPLISSINIPREVSVKLRGEEVLMAAYGISDRLFVEYKESQFIIKVKKQERDRSWIYLLNAFFEKLA